MCACSMAAALAGPAAAQETAGELTAEERYQVDAVELIGVEHLDEDALKRVLARVRHRGCRGDRRFEILRDGTVSFPGRVAISPSQSALRLILFFSY